MTVKDSDFEAFAEVWEACFENYPRSQTPTARAVNMAFDVLERFELRQITRALTAHLSDPQQGQFAPKPADVVRHIEGTPDDAAMEAWHKVDQALRRVGYGPALVFDDPKIHQVLTEMGGFAQFGRATEQDMQFLRNTFCKRYASLRAPSDYPPAIAGWHTDGERIFIGDPGRCQRVLESGNDRPVALASAGDVAGRLLEDMGGDGRPPKTGEFEDDETI